MNYQIKAESGQQLLARLSSRPSLSGLDELLLGADGPLSRDIIEIAGEASVGKSMLVLQWIARAILSPPRGGLGVEVLLIDTDHHQPLVILVRLIEARMKEFIAKAPTSSRLKLSSSLVETSIKDALKRLTILNAYDSTNLYTALLALDKMLLSKPQISLVVVDSLPAFYWADRLSGGLQHMDSYLKHLLSALQKSTADHKVTVVFTRPSHFQSGSQSRYKSKDNSGQSTVFISLNREVKPSQQGECSKSNTNNASAQGVVENLFCATVRTAYGQKSYNYRTAKDGVVWV